MEMVVFLRARNLIYLPATLSHLHLKHMWLWQLVYPPYETVCMSFVEFYGATQVSKHILKA